MGPGLSQNEGGIARETEARWAAHAGARCYLP